MTFKFNTEPKIMSEKLMKIATSGRINQVLDAINNERSNHDSNIGRAEGIKVTRVGGFPYSKAG